MDHSSRLIEVADGFHVWMPSGLGTWGLANCGLLATEGTALLVDTPYDLPMTYQLLDASRHVMAPGSTIDQVVTTHANGDHSFGLGAFPQAEIIGTDAYVTSLDHEPTPQQMHGLTTLTAPDTPMGWYMRTHFGRYDYAGSAVVPPTRTFSGSLDLRVGEAAVQLVEAGPAHSDGDLVAVFPDHGVCMAGDLIFAGDHPAHWAGPMDRVIAGCEAILATGAETVVPGHGPLMNAFGVRNYIAYLEWVRDSCKARHLAGDTPLQAAVRLIDSGRYRQLGLAERLVITVATEFRHLEGESEAHPDLVALAGAAAGVAWDRRVPSQRGAAHDAAHDAEPVGLPRG